MQISERAVSEFVKDYLMVQNLHTVLEYLADDEEDVDEDGNSIDKRSYPHVATKCAATANRQLATSPDSMDAS